MRYLAALAFVACLSPTSSGAAGGCLIEGPGTCHSDFREFAAATADGPRRLVAVGKLRAPSAPGYDTAVVAIEPAGDPVVIQPPSDPAPNGQRPLSFVEGRDIVRLADGDFVVFGVAVYGEGNTSTYAGWAARIGLDGTTRWSRTYPGPNETHQLFHFGLGLRDGRLLAGGRRQQGQDPDGTCDVLSRTLLALINPETGDLLQKEAVDGSRGHRRAFYAGAEWAQGFAFIGFATGPKQGSPGKCQDDLFYVWTDPSLQPFNQQQFGDPSANDLGLDLLFHEDKLLSAGVTSIDRPVAFVDAFLAEGGVPLSFRRGAGEGGRDHVSAIAWHPLAQDYVAIGSWSESASGWYKAWWFRLDQDLVPTDELAFSAYPGSALNGLGILADGRTIAVGYVRPEEGDSTMQFGWSVDIDPGRSIPKEPAISFRPADASLPPLDRLPLEGGAYLAGEIGNAPLSFYQGASEAGSRHMVDVDLSSATSLRVIVHPQGGDIDIVLRRVDGSLVDFSNYRGGATEMIEAELGPGRYRLNVLVNEAVEGFDVSLARAEQLAVLSPTGDALLGIDARLQLASVLEGLGYFVGSEIEITVSPETIRAFAAVQSAVGAAVDGILDDGAWSQIVSR